MWAASLSEERTWQASWQAKNPRVQAIAEELLQNEFSTSEQIEQLQLKGLRAILEIAGRSVPYYRSLSQLQNEPAHSAEELLSHLPILRKVDVQLNFEVLQGEHLPEHLRGNLIMQSSGTTGKPTRVLFNAESHRRRETGGTPATGGSSSAGGSENARVSYDRSDS